MGAEAVSTGSGRSGSGKTKKGKPRPGTGGYGRRALEGKGPTPPAAMRPGHPAQRRAAAAAAAGSRGPRRADDSAASRGPRRADDSAGSPARAARGAAPSSGPSARAPRGSGDAPEFVAGRNPVVESLRAAVPSVALYVGTRVQHDERISEAIKLAAGRGVAVLKAGPAELDRLTGGALHQGLALRVRPYDYAHPDDLLARAADAGQLPLIVALDGVTDPRNLGAVARSAGAFGAHGVVVPARRGAGVTAGAWKASAGALARVPVARAANLARTLASYQDAGLFVGRPGRGRRHTRPRPGAGHCPAGPGHRLRGPRPVPHRRPDLRRPGPHSHRRPHRIPQRRRSRRHHPLRSRRHPLPPHHPLTHSTPAPYRPPCADNARTP